MVTNSVRSVTALPSGSPLQEGAESQRSIYECQPPSYCRPWSCIGQEIGDNRVQTRDLVGDDVHQPLVRFIEGKFSAEELDGATDRGQWVANFVGNGGRQTTDRRQLLAPFDLGLHGTDGRDVLKIEDQPMDRPWSSRNGE